MNNKNTKRALLTSVLSLAVCGSMLVGTTFAWFTDSVSSTNNVITTGNLDMKVSYKAYGSDKTEWTEMTETSSVFNKNALWEPGYTEAVWLKVENVGSLAFKYQITLDVISEVAGVNAQGETFELSELLVVESTPSTDYQGFENFFSRDNLSSSALKEAGKLTDGTIVLANNNVVFPTTEAVEATPTYLLVVISMPETVGNEANHNGVKVPEINFGINAVATQVVAESDSFGNDYDANATYTDEAAIRNASGYVYVANNVALEEETTELKNAATINLNGQTISATRSYESGMNAAQISTLTVCNDVTLTGNGTVINKGVGYGIVVREGGNLVIENGYYYGTTSAVQVSEGTLEIKGGHFEDLSNEDNGHYLINCIDGNYTNKIASVVITGGTFVNWNPANNTSEGKGTNFVAPGYMVIEKVVDADTTEYTVVENVVAENVELTGKITSANCDTSSGKNYSTVYVTSDATISGTGTIENTVGYAVYLNNADATLTIKGGNFIGDCTAVNVKAGTLVIEGGFFQDNDPDASDDTYANGHYLINCIDANYKNGTAKVVITGGTFVNWNPANNASEGAGTDFVPAGYKVVENVVDKNTTEYTVVEVAPTVVATVADLKTALTEATNNGETEVVINANGANIGDLNYGLTTASVPAGSTVTIKNAVVEGQSYGNAVAGTVIFENCTFTNDWAYSIHFDAGNGDVIFKNCTLEGWCSFGSAINSVTMENCTLKGNGIYAMYRFYQNTTLTNCTIECNDTNSTDDYPDGISAVNGAVVTLNGCTLTYCDFEVAENAKIVVDGNDVVVSVENSEVVIKNANR